MEYCLEPLCGTCKGTKWLYGKECHICGGTGQGRYTTAFRAGVLEIPRTTYLRVWEKRRREIEDLFRDIIPERESDASRELNKRLFWSTEST